MQIGQREATLYDLTDYLLRTAEIPDAVDRTHTHDIAVSILFRSSESVPSVLRDMVRPDQ